MICRSLLSRYSIALPSNYTYKALARRSHTCSTKSPWGYAGLSGILFREWSFSTSSIHLSLAWPTLNRLCTGHTGPLSTKVPLAPLAMAIFPHYVLTSMILTSRLKLWGSSLSLCQIVNSVLSSPASLWGPKSPTIFSALFHDQAAKSPMLSPNDSWIEVHCETESSGISLAAFGAGAANASGSRKSVDRCTMVDRDSMGEERTESRMA